MAASTLGACTPEPVNLGRITLNLWQPVDEGTLLSEASESTLRVDVDGDVVERSFVDGVVPFFDDHELNRLQGGDVSIDIWAEHDVGANARARVGPFAFEGDTEVAGVLARERSVQRLSDDIGPHDGVAACSDGVDVFFAGGEAAGAVSDEVRILDANVEGVTTRSGGSARRRDGDCVVWDDRTFVVGGCTASGIDVDSIEQVASNSPMADVAIGGAGCGTRALVIDDQLVVSTGEEVVLFDASFTEVRRWSLTQTRYNAQLSSNGEVLFVAGGVDDLANATPLSTTSLVTLGATSAPMERNGRWYATPDGSVEVDDDGSVGTSREFSSGDVDALLPLTSDDRWVALSADGSALLLSTTASGAGTARTLPLPQPRPGGRLLQGPHHEVYIVGGGEPGLDVFVPDGD